MRRSSFCLAVAVAALLCSGCVSKSDYLQKESEAEALARTLSGAASDNVALREQVTSLTAERDRLTAERDKLSAERDRLVADREKLRAERDDLNARLGALRQEQARAAAEAGRTIAELTARKIELEGDKQMLEEGIALLKKNSEEQVRKIRGTYEALLTNAREETLQASKAYEELLEEVKREAAKPSAEQEEHLKEARQDAAEAGTEQEERPKEAEEGEAKASAICEQLLKEMETEIEQGQLAVTELKGRLTVELVEQILFNPGRSEIKPGGIAVLKRVADILKTVTDKSFRVEGHTDNEPLRGSLAKQYPTGWELSAARAVSVTRYLERAGLDPSLLSAAAFGMHQPVADNDTEEGRAKNRRIAIILLPKEER